MHSIPLLHPVKEWKKTEIHDNGEKLVSTQSRGLNRVISKPQYKKMGIPGALDEIYVRSGVVERLEEAAGQLPNGYRLLVWDGWRPFKVQQHIYESYLNQLVVEHPDWSEERLHEGTRQFVSFPSDDHDTPAPHITGGAVDLTIVDGIGVPLPMGTDFDDFSEQARTRFYEEKSEHGKLLDVENEYLANRRMLYQAMTSVGFTNYPEEWWHFDYGNQWWAKSSNQPAALYGLARLDSH
ncbi:M15 family metallopeptidase [Alkalihalobacillus sp. AL-G]|uniref:M15 family metallopeptidase n=1 Tax=Alkalihalobacillus sp. AL-G TaxID=2926399 RepID=UPI00272962FC|nr:M15 family metallopeptidase [Alkalihalobacillus sp. AL-G]WLD93918.1 M15 family metallopeptidase [Alkalihalobacillus sp. AL-G]